MRPVAGSTTVAMRSNRQRRAVPPKRRRTASSASTRCARSWASAKTARAWLEYDSAPTSTCAVPPHGAPGRSAQSHCSSWPGGWSSSVVSRPVTPAHASQRGRSRWVRSARVKLG
jgi:hypothetical protein